MDEEVERTIVVEIPPTFMDIDQESGAMSQQLDKYGGGWVVYPTINQIIYYEDSVDLSGYSIRDLTFVPFASFTQEGLYNTFIDGVGYLRYDCISTVPLDITKLISTMASGGAPGFTAPFDPTAMNSYVAADRTQIIHGESTVYANDVTYPGTDIVSERYKNTSSSLEPTASDKLFVYSVVFLDANVDADPGATPPIFPFGSYLALAPRRIIMPGKWTKEPELEYMMRLKRSYELANQV